MRIRHGPRSGSTLRLTITSFTSPCPRPASQLSARLPEVRPLFAGFPIEEVETRYSVSAKATRQVGELLISGGDSPA